jgi:hypothetical protein
VAAHKSEEASVTILALDDPDRTGVHPQYDRAYSSFFSTGTLLKTLMGI